MQKTVLVLGVTGRFGRHAAEAFWNAGWTVRLFDRVHDDLMTRAQGADIIVAAWNPPYHLWEQELPGLHARIQAAARSSGAAVFLPGNVYVYGPDTAKPWSETTRQAPPTALGRIRQQVEQSYRDSGLQTILLRSGDFLDIERDGGWLDKVLMSRTSRGQLVYPGDADALHAWAFLPDLARAAEHLARRKSSLSQFEEVVFPGYAITGHQFAQHISQALHHDIKVHRMSWLPLRLAAPFWPLARGLLEMRYLWDLPHSLQSERLAELCPDYRDTPMDEALTQVVAPWRGTARPTRCRSCHFSKRSTQTSP